MYHFFKPSTSTVRNTAKKAIARKLSQLSKQFEIQSKVYFYLFPVVKSDLLATILDKILETIEHFESIFLKIIAVPILPFSPPLGSKVVVSCKATLILERL